MKLKTLTQDRDYRELPRIPRESVALLWHDDFWDGPLSGLLLWNGERCWFQFREQYEPLAGVAEGPWPWYRRFLVIRLTPDQLREEESWHELFRKCVGTHTAFQDGQREGGVVESKEQWAEFYDAYSKRVSLDLNDNEVVGWFED